MSQTISPRMLPIRAAAEYLGSTVWHVRSLTWDKKLPYLKFGNRLVYDVKDLDAFIDRMKSDR
jgi:hypothetical protein